MSKVNVQPLASIVIPARNEEALLPKCLDALEQSLSAAGCDAEIIVVCNRCTDRTAEVAAQRGCLVVENSYKNLSKIRNHGASKARGEILVTVDADSVVSPGMFSSILSAMKRGKYVGGGVVILPERWSFGIFLTGLMILPLALRHMISGGLFFARKEDFHAIGGFDPSLNSAEDIDFAKRLKAHGRATGKRFKILKSSWIITSCRKFDHFGDWYFVLRPWLLRELLRGRSKDFANEFWYEFN